MNDEKIVFEDYGIEFSDEDFEGIDEKTLKKCKERLERAINIVEKKGEK